jgi:TP901 family phage tail tape measure protein
MTALDELSRDLNLVISRFRELSSEISKLSTANFDKFIELEEKLFNLSKGGFLTGGVEDFLNKWNDVRKSLEGVLGNIEEIDSAMASIAQKGQIGNVIGGPDQLTGPAAMLFKPDQWRVGSRTIQSIINQLKELQEVSSEVGRGAGAGDVAKKFEDLFRGGRFIAGGPQELIQVWKELEPLLNLSVEDSIRLNTELEALITRAVELERFKGMTPADRALWVNRSSPFAQNRGLAPEPNMRQFYEGELERISNQQIAEGRLAALRPVWERDRAEIELRVMWEKQVTMERERQAAIAERAARWEADKARAQTPLGLNDPYYTLRWQFNQAASIRGAEEQYNPDLVGAQNQQEAIAASEAEQLVNEKRLAEVIEMITGEKQEQVEIDARLADQQKELTEGAGKEKKQEEDTRTAREKKLQQLKEELEARRALLREPARAEGVIPGGQTAARNVLKTIEGLKFEISDLTSVTTEGASQTTKWAFAMRDADGVMHRATVTTDKYGNVLQDMSTRFRSFFSTVGRDIVKVLQWGIAAGLVYGSIRKFNELIKESIEIQTRLADVQVALGRATTNINTVFETSATVARQFGTEVAGVIDGYLLAYRAAGQYSDEAERTRVATELLADSMMLAKLSGMSQAQALDHLTASLRQLGMPLTDGSILLDKWVAVTRIANVDLATLAEGFAIMGGAAEGVGIDIDRLNAIVAAFAEATQYSGTEVANAIRGFVAGFQSEQVGEAISRYGIAFRDVNGDMLDFTRVLDDIADRFQRGIISEEQLSEIANVMGGGWRRGAQLMSLFRNWGRVADIYTVSLNASGDAEEALAIRMDTVQTALTNMKNAFSELARALGMQGGFLDLIQKGVEFLTGIIDSITDLTKTLGKAIPVITAFALAWKFSRTSMGQQITGNLAQWGITGEEGLEQIRQQREVEQMSQLVTQMTGQVIPVPGRGDLFRDQFANFTNQADSWLQQWTTSLATQTWQKLGTGAGMGAVAWVLSGELSRAMNASLSDAAHEQSWAKLGFTLAGSALGTLATGSPYVGTIIGQVASQALIQNLNESRGDLRPFLEAIYNTTPPPTTPPPTTPEDIAADTLEFISDVFGPTAEWLLGRAEDAARQEYEYGKEQQLGVEHYEATPEEVRGFQTEVLLRTIIGDLGAIEAQNFIGPLMAWDAAQFRSPEDIARAQVLLDAIHAMGSEIHQQTEALSPGSPFINAVVAIAPIAAPIVGRVATTARAEAYQQFSLGEISGKQLDQIITNLETAALLVDDFYAALGSDAQAILGVETVDDAISTLADTVINLSSEERERLNALKDAVAQAMLEFETAPTAAAAADLDAKRRAYIDAIEGDIYARRYQQIEIPQVQFVSEEATRAQIEAGIVQAAQWSAAYLENLFPNDPDAQRKMMESWDDFAILSGETYTNKWGEVVSGLMPGAFERAMEEMGLTYQGGRIQWDIQTVTPQEFGALPSQQMIDALTTRIIDLTGGGWQPNEAEMLIFNQDTREYTRRRADSMIWQMLMRDVIQNQEKQMEGVFNLPADMAALVPMTGQLYFSTSPIAQGGTGGTGSWADLLTEPANTLDNAGLDLSNAAAELTAAGVAMMIVAGTPQNQPTTLTPEEQAAASAYQANLIRRANALLWRRGHGLLPEDYEPQTTEPTGGREVPTTRPWGVTPATTEDVWNEIVDKWNNMMSSQFPAVDQAITKINGWIDSLMSSLYFPYRGIPFPAGGGGGNMYSPRPTNLKPLEDMMPQSIPITTKVTLNNQNIVYVDGQKILDALLKREHVDFSNAKRRTGTVAYDVSY